MKIMDAVSSLSNTPHIFETPDDIIINSQIYDKHTFKPKEYSFFSSRNMLANWNLLDESIELVGAKESTLDKGIDYKNLIQDSEDRNIFYYLGYELNNANNIYLYKIQKTENSYNILDFQTYQTASDNNSFVQRKSFKFITQTENYIILAENHYSKMQGTNTHTYGANPIIGYDIKNLAIKRIQKFNIKNSSEIIFFANNNHNSAWDSGHGGVPQGQYNDVLSKSSTTYGCSIYLIKQTDTYLYLYVHTGNSIQIYKYNFVNNTGESLYEFSEEYIKTNCIGLSNIIEFQHKYYVLTGNETQDSYALQEININYTNDKVTLKEIPIIHDDFVYEKNGWSDYKEPINGITKYIIYTLKNINEEYIGLTIHNQEGGTIISGHDKHILIKHEDSNFDIIYCLSIPDCFGVLYYNSTVSVVLTTEGYVFYKLENDLWKEVFRESGSWNYIGFDSYKRFYTIDKSNQVKIQSNLTTCRLTVSFADGPFEFTGTNINTHIIVDARNFLNEFVKAKIKIVLSGNAVFVSNNKKEIVITTDKNQLTTVDYIINGPGKIELNAIELEG